MELTLQPTLLQWARQRAGLNEAALAKKLRTSPQKVVDWERTGRVSLARVEKLAKATYTPLGYLYLSKPPDEQLPIPDFRTVGSEIPPHPSPNLLDTLDDALQRQDWFREYLILRGENPLPFVGSLSAAVPIKEAAAAIRMTVGFDAQLRAQVATWEDALRLQVEIIEECGILVMRAGIARSNTRRRLSVPEFRGFALSDAYAPLIFVNARDSKAAQIFTLAHELVHIWIGSSGVSNLDRTYADGVETERFCNAVAAELLVPEVEFREKYLASRREPDLLKALTRHFKVSSLVILRRMRDLGFLNEGEFRERYEAEERRFANQSEGKAGGGDFYASQNTRLGRRFARALIESTLEGRTPYRDALRLLGISKLETFKEFAREHQFIT